MARPEVAEATRIERRAVLVDLVAAVVAVVAGLVVAGRSEFNRDVVLLVCVYALVGLGMYIPLVLNGELSLAYSAYAAIGAYAVGLIGTETSVPPVLGVPAGMATAAVVAAVLGVATARLNGFYLAGVTLLFDRAFRAYLLEAEWTGGAAGLPGLTPGSLVGIDLDRAVVLRLALVLTVLAATYVSRLRRGPFGLMARFQRESGRITESSGVRSALLKVTCLSLGAAVASVAGALSTLSSGSVFPDTFGLNIVIIAIFAPLLGGQRSPWGALIGASIVAYLFFGLEIAQDSGALYFAIAVIAVVRLARDGILGLAGAAARAVTAKVVRRAG